MHQLSAWFTRNPVAANLLMVLIVVAGRMIAYNWFDCDKEQSDFIVWAAGCPPEGP